MRTYVRFLDDLLADDALLIESDPTKERPAPAAAPSHGPLMSAVLPDWVNQRTKSESNGKKSRRPWSGERRDTCEAVMRDFVDLVGDRPISSYQKADARAFKKALLALPSNWMKRKALRASGCSRL